MEEETKDYAILLIYPDGEVEKIPITIYEDHFSYLKEHFENSEKFKKMTYRIDWEDDTHYGVSGMLAMQGVIEIANKDMCIKIKNAKFYKEFCPEFYFYYPEYLGSIEQLNALEYFEKRIPTEKLIYYEYDDKIFNFDEKTYNQFENWKEENRNRFESEIHKL